MHESFDLLRAIEKLLVRGKLDDARSLAKSIAQAPDEPGLDTWGARAALVRERAAAVANATTVEEGCRREAKLAEACAGCHLEAGVVPEFKPSALPPDKPSVGARMARHLWAADRMWEGMVGGSDEAWLAGLDVLAMPPVRELPRDRLELARRMQQLADQARQRKSVDDLGERARAYGEILATCAACHTR